ncbi:MAG: deoxyribose-phosphate aldolase [Candidatus Micrarchaeaceae archaeon]
MEYDLKTVMGIIDHSGLKGYASEADTQKLIDEAHEFGNFAVCIEPVHMNFATDYIKRMGYNIKVDVVLDFPLGASYTEARVELAKLYAKTADEIDIVSPIALVKSGKWDAVKNDINAIVKAVHDAGKIIKVIVEDAYTTKEEKLKLYEIVCKSGADFIKTGTGFEEKDYPASLGNKTGAQVENVLLMKQVADKFNPRIGIKVAGGIHTYAAVKALIEASGRAPDPNKFRVGASGTRKIYDELKLMKII